MRLLKFFFLFNLLLVLNITPSILANETTDKQSVVKVTQQWIEYYNEQNIDGLMSLFTDDCVTLPPEKESYTGKSRKREELQDYFNSNSDINYKGTSDVQVSGDLAYEHFNYHETWIDNKTKEKMEETGKGIGILVRQDDGSWKYSHEIWNKNADKPASIGIPVISPISSGQEWTEEQKELWKAEETFWNAFMNEDIKAAMAEFHPQSSGWFGNKPVPDDKASETKWMTYDFANNDFQFIDLKPLVINVIGDTALVQYQYTMAVKSNDGVHRVEQGRFSDFYIKENGKWLLIGYHGGPDKID